MKIVAKIIGGLGNQMFIYATAKAMSLRTGADLVLDTQSGYENEPFKRTFLLDSFDVSYQKASCTLQFDYWQGGKMRSIGKRLHFSLMPLMKYISENNSHDFVSGLLEKHSLTVYLDGYWQDERYFKDYTSVIKKDFRITQVDDSQTLDEAEIITHCANPVAIGVRRYQELASHQNTKVTDLNFYLKAINYIETRVDNPTFFVFSEDHEWVKNNLGQKFNIIIISTKEGDFSALNDMYLMNLCKHHIVSNSSFYWWGAWLASSPNQIVVASDCFLNPRSVPNSWIKF